jgi:hypothetical protein
MSKLSNALKNLEGSPFSKDELDEELLNEFKKQSEFTTMKNWVDLSVQ